MYNLYMETNTQTLKAGDIVALAGAPVKVLKLYTKSALVRDESGYRFSVMIKDLKNKS